MSSQTESTVRAGTQSIQRSLAIIRILAASNVASGVSFAEIQEMTGLNKSTLYRILRTLEEEGFAERHLTSGLYFLGMNFLALGSASLNRFNLREICRPTLERIADKTEDTVYLSIRTGADAMCVDRVVGDFPIRTLTLNVGDRRPLGIGGGSLALLSWLSDDEIDDVIKRNVRRLRAHRMITLERLREAVRRTRENGYAFNDGQVLKSMCAIGVPVFGSQGRPIAALSLASIAERLSEDRRMDLFALLGREAKALSAILVSRGADRTTGGERSRTS